MEMSEKVQFLDRRWHCYRLLDWSLPYGNRDNFSLQQIIRGFQNFSPYFELDVDPFGCESLFCATLYISVKPSAQHKFASKKKVDKKRADKTAKQKEVASKKSKMNRDPKRKAVDARPGTSRDGSGSALLDESDDGGSSDDELGERGDKYFSSMSQAIRLNKEIVIKVCLSTEGRMLFTNRSLSGWLLGCFARSLGVRTLHDSRRRNASNKVSRDQSNRPINRSQVDRDELSDNSLDPSQAGRVRVNLSGNNVDKDVDGFQMQLYCIWNGDPRHLLKLNFQRGCEEDSSRSTYALAQHEWVRAQQRRLRPPGSFAPPGCSSFPVGDVTKRVGALPHDFPKVQKLDVTVKNIPLLSTLPLSAVDIDPDVLEQCKAQLTAQGSISTMRVQLSSASVLHLYYNASVEASVARNNTLEALRHTLRALEAPLRAPRVLPSSSEAKLQAANEAERAGLFWALSGRAFDGYLSTTSDEDEPGTSASKTKKAKTTKKKKKKCNVEGVVTKVPLFLDSLRSSSSFKTTMDYQGPS